MEISQDHAMIIHVSLLKLPLDISTKDAKISFIIKINFNDKIKITMTIQSYDESSPN
jgi:hypothetical protein